MNLLVYLNESRVGLLHQDKHGQLFFSYESSWLESKIARPLSQSLPLRKEPFKKNQCRPFFAGLLPEAEKREIIAKNLGVSENNDFSLLAKIGGECGGAISFIPPEKKPHFEELKYQLLSEEDLFTILKELPKKPLLAGQRGIRLSLAGAQDKIPLYYTKEQFYLPLNASPSTHILKPAIKDYKEQVYNEAFGLRLAIALDLPTAWAESRKIKDQEFLLVERYDRKKVEHGKVLRVHQEDFCQALGIVPEKKYQMEGGPTLKQCFDLVRKVSSAPIKDLKTLLDAVIFNMLIGNSDAHGKNFSLLYTDNGTILAPLYDLLSTVIYEEIDPRMAMKWGGEDVFERLKPAHFERFSHEVELSHKLVLQRVKELASQLEHILQNMKLNHDIERAIAKLIFARSERIKRLVESISRS